MIKIIVIVICVLVLSDATFEGDRCIAEEVVGICTLLPNCSSAIEAIKRRDTPKICGFNGLTPIVCCVDNNVPTVTATQPSVPITTQKQPSTTTPEMPYYVDSANMYPDNTEECKIPLSLTSTKTGQKAFDKCIEYQQQFVYPCEKPLAGTGGMKLSNHCQHNVGLTIFDPGATDTIRYEFPHMVMLGYGDNEQSISWLCSGSIISENYILTAGHCITTRDMEEVKYVLLGALSKSDVNNTNHIYKIKRIVRHPDFKPPLKYNDISLLETEKKIPLSQYIVPACLHVGDPINDEVVIATGWGLTNHNTLDTGIMQKVFLNKFSTQECENKYPKDRNLLNGFDPQTQICYGDRSGARDTCKGDSGGPIQIKSKKIHCMYTVVGVMSFGRACGFPAQPEIYTRVAHYVPWIESIVWP